MSHARSRRILHAALSRRAAGTAGEVIPLAAILRDGAGFALPGRAVSFALGGASLAATTDSTGVARASWSATSVGTLPLTASFAGEPGYPPAQASATLSIAQAPTVLALGSGVIISASGAAQVSAVLRAGSAWTPLAGRTVTFTLGGQSARAVTDASGAARVGMNGLQPGPGSLTAAFAGDSLYLASSASEAATVGESSAFVIWGGNPAGLALDQQVTFWGAQWSAEVQGGDFTGNPSFKGYAEMGPGLAVCEPLAHTARAPLLDPACWTTKPGNSGPPSTVPAYLAVTISTAIAKSGSMIYGNSAALGILRVAPGYGPNPGHPGTGTLVAIAADGAGLFPEAALALSQTQPATVLPGQPFAVTAAVTNTGTAAATGLVIAEVVTGASPASATLAVGSLAAGATQTGALSVTAPPLAARGAAEASDAYLARLVAATAAPIVSAGTATAGPQPPAHASSTSALQPRS